MTEAAAVAAYSDNAHSRRTGAAPPMGAVMATAATAAASAGAPATGRRRALPPAARQGRRLGSEYGRAGAGAEAAAEALALAADASPDLSKSWRETIQRGDRAFWHGEASVETYEDDNTRWLSVLATSEVELMLTRLSRDAVGMSPVWLPAHAENARIVRMVAAEYPLKMKTPDMWTELFDEIAADEGRADAVMSLDKRDPPGAVFLGRLMPHQQEALDYMEKCAGQCLIADEMGLGKTVETLAYLAGRSGAYPVAVVAPLVAITHWYREIDRFLRVDGPCDGGRIDAGAGGAGGGNADANAPRTPVVEVIRAGRKPWPGAPRRPADFYLINYDLVAKWAYALSGAGIRTIIFDECQALRHTASQRYAACRRLALSRTVRHRIALSGTPVYNGRVELHNISEVIRPGILGSQSEFTRRWPSVGSASWEDIGEEERTKEAERRRSDLATMLRRRFMLRRLKSEAVDLPAKTRLHQEIDIDDGYYTREVGRLLSSISAECRRIKEGVAEGGVDRGADGGGRAGGKRAGLLELHNRLMQMRVAERQIAGVSKAGSASRYVGSLLADYTDDKFVVFCHHRSVREILCMDLRRFGVATIAGGQAPAERQGEIDRFQRDPECRVMVAGLRAGNVGISLSAASYVVFAELDWSPSVHRQAEDRLHRIGQKNPVVCHYLIGRGTFDDQIAKTVVRKTLDISGVMGEVPGRVDTVAALETIAERYGAKAARMAGATRYGHGQGGGGASSAVCAHARSILADLDALRAGAGKDGGEGEGEGEGEEEEGGDQRKRRGKERGRNSE